MKPPPQPWLFCSPVSPAAAQRSPDHALLAPQVDKLEASESLRKQEEQATESQPIVYGKDGKALHVLHCGTHVVSLGLLMVYTRGGGAVIVKSL